MRAIAMTTKNSARVRNMHPVSQTGVTEMMGTRVPQK